jgi:CBS domain-containing protein
MRAHQIMTKDVITVTPHSTIEQAAKIMLQTRISGLPVLDDAGSLVGFVSESDFLRRNEIGTGRKRPAWLQFFMGPGHAAAQFVHERGRRVEDVMTQDPITVNEETPLEELVRLMEKNDIKRLPVMSGNTLKGIVTRSNLLQAVASMAHEIPDPTADDDHIRDRIITTDQARQATIVAAENTAGVKEVHDHLCLVDSYSGFYVEAPEDMKAAG